MTDGGDDSARQRNATIAENEEQRQVVSAVRVSTWAIAVAVLIGVVFFGWLLVGR